MYVNVFVADWHLILRIPVNPSGMTFKPLRTKCISFTALSTSVYLTLQEMPLCFFLKSVTPALQCINNTFDKINVYYNFESLFNVVQICCV